MEFIKPDVNIEFIARRKIAYGVSLLLILATVVTLAVHRGPRYGIDFSGGTLIQVKFASPTTIAAVKTGLAAVNLGASSVQSFGRGDEAEYLVRTDASGPEVAADPGRIAESLSAAAGSQAEIRRVEMVGPQVGKDLREKALFAMFYALLFIAIYISGRFELKWILSAVMAGALIAALYVLKLLALSTPFLIVGALAVTLVLFWFLELKYAMGAIVALIHDVLITVGVFSIFTTSASRPKTSAKSPRSAPFPPTTTRPSATSSPRP